MSTLPVFVPLQSHTDYLDPLFDNVDTHLAALNCPSSKEGLMSKKTLIDSGKINGIIGLDTSKAPIGFMWAEVQNDTYGHMIIHCIDPKYNSQIIDAFFKEVPLKNCVVELIQFTKGFEIRDQLCARGHVEKERQRMILEIPDHVEAPTFRDGVSFEPINKGTIDIVADISSRAHAPRNHIECYGDFGSFEGRVQMEKQLLAGVAGAMCEQVSTLMRVNGEPAGNCDVIIVKNSWGYTELPWIMDISIHPQFQGMGLGRYLLNTAIYRAKQANYPAIGLGVTLTNYSALELYNNIGFEPVEIFVEFIIK